MTFLSIASFALLLTLSVEVMVYYTHSNTYYCKRPVEPIYRYFSMFYLAAGSVSLSSVLFSIEGYTGQAAFFEVGRWMELITCIGASLSLIYLVKATGDIKDD